MAFSQCFEACICQTCLLVVKVHCIHFLKKYIEYTF